jgi:hypothetical protein
MKTLLILISVALLASCGGGGSNSTTSVASEIKAEEELTSGVVFKSVTAPVQVASPTVEGITLKSQRRIARTVFEYEFTVQISTGNTPLNGINLMLKTVGAGSQIIDGAVVTGAVVANSTVTPNDTILVQHDRTQAFDPNSFAWNISASPIIIQEPLIAGQDSNNDGVRDDVEAFIKTSSTIPVAARTALTKLANGMQEAALASSKAQALVATKKRMDAAICLSGLFSQDSASTLVGEISRRQFDTPSRVNAELAYRRLIGGEAFWPDFTKPSQSFCN